MCTMRRRQFLAACGASAVGVLGLNLLTPQAARATTNFQYLIHNGFNQNDTRIIRRALDLVAAHLTSPGVCQSTYQTANRSLVDNNYCAAVGIPTRGDWSWACMRYQLDNYLRPHIPRVNIHPYFLRDGSWGRAQVGIVRTLNLPQRTGQFQGEFVIHLNRLWLGNGQAGNDAGVWAGVIAHEMMHNLGHMHGHNEYGLHLQINALQAAVYSACASVLRTSDSDDFNDNSDFLERHPFCGS